jgi:hypothetical protein
MTKRKQTRFRAPVYAFAMLGVLTDVSSVFAPVLRGHEERLTRFFRRQ